MITLSNIESRIRELEIEEYSSVNERLSTWRNMCAWQYWLNSLPDRDNWRKDFEALPLSHPIRELAGRLTWLEVQLSPVLTARRDGFWSERVYVALDAVFSDVMENYTLSQEEISSLEVMNDMLEVVNTLLDNDELWQGFYEGKRQEAEQWELRQKYRRMANFGELSEEAIEWLRINDSAFLENLNAKKQSEVKPEVKPVASETIENLGTTVPTLPQNEARQPDATGPVSEFILAHWAGVDEGWLCDTAFGTLPVYRNREYRLSLETWKNIQSDSYLRQRWHKVSNGA